MSSVNKKFEELTVATIVSAMMDIAPSMEAWVSATLSMDGLWFKLARRYVKTSDKKYAYRLKIRFDRNRKNLKASFGEAVGSRCFKIKPPKQSSTPKPREKICACRRIYSPSDGSVIGCDKCDRWFHGGCIRTNVAIEGKKKTWLCPECKDNHLFVYREDWLESKSFETDAVSNVTSPMSDAKQQHTIVSLEDADNQDSPSRNELPIVVEEDQISATSCGTRTLPPTDGSLTARRKLAFDDDDDYLRSIEPTASQIGQLMSSELTLQGETFSGHAIVKSCSQKCKPSFRDDASLQLHDAAVSEKNESKSLSPRKPRIVLTEPSQADLPTPLEDPKYSSTEQVGTSVEAHDNHDDFSDEDCEEVNSYMAKKGIQKPAARFYIEIERAAWDANLKSQDPPKLKSAWGNMFRDAIKPHNRLCSFSFHGHEFLQGRLGSFFRARGHCKHGRTLKTKSEKPCWKIEVIGLKGRSDQNLKFRVICEGDFRHKMGNRERNYISGTKREAMKQLLRHRKAGKLAADLNRAADMDEILCGNATSLHGTKVLAQIRHEELAKKDLDQDPFIDLYKRLKTKDMLNSYVRVASAKPLCILMVSKDQLEVLKLMRKVVKPLVGHLDATGSIVRKLPLEDVSIFLYAVVVSSPMKGEPPLPIGEFLLSDQSRASISFALNSFLRICKSYLNLPSADAVFSRFETDDSAAIYGAVIEQTTHCKNVSEYLDHCWRELFTNEPPLKCNSHLCRAHAIIMLMKQGKKDQYLLGDSGMNILFPLLSNFLESKTMYEVSFYVQRIFVLCLSEYENPEVVSILANPHKPMPANFVPNYDWKAFLEKADEDNGRIWSSTAFGRLFIYIKTEVLSNINSLSTSNAMSNDMHSPRFISYLQREVLPYTPLFTHVMMAIRGDNSSVDTNDRVERWNREVKVVESFNNEKLPRYVEDNLESIQGRCKRFEASLHAYANERRRLERQTVSGSCNTPRRPIIFGIRKTPTSTADRNANRDKKMQTQRSLQRPRRSLWTAKTTNVCDTPTLLEAIAEERSYEQKEQWRKKGSQVAQRTAGIRHFQNLPVLLWGAQAKDQCSKVFTNTCTIDNFFMILIYAHHNNLAWRQYIQRPRNQLMETINTLVNYLVEPEPRVNTARLHFVRSILNRNPLETHVDLHGDEITNTVEPLQYLSTDYRVDRRCPVHGSKGSVVLQVFGRCNMDVLAIVQLINSGGLPRHCSVCSELMENVVEKPPPNVILPVISFGVFAVKNLHDLPLQVPILDDEYELFACSVYQEAPPPFLGHYYAAFLYNNKWYGFDARKGRVTTEIPPHNLVSTCWYKRKN